MFGALVETVDKAKRVIFVGDPNQLPPIGTGKPFYELVQKLRAEDGQPRYANLLVSNRQKQSNFDDVRLDVALGKMFTEDAASQVGDNLFERIARDNENIEFVKCEDVSLLPQTVFDTLEKASGITDIDSFDLSLGGVVNGEWMNFEDAGAIADWQLLTPYRNKELSGSLSLNRGIHLKYRPNEYENCKYKKVFTKYPLGSDTIIYGEKVINIRNQDKKGYLRSEEKYIDGHIANGEVGIVRKIWQRTKSNKVKANTHEVVFSSQDEISYNYFSNISEGESDLELAYALTVHKAQGSGFRATVFILIEPECGIDPFVTRELLYTALTRQSDKVFIIYNKQPTELKKYTNPEYSDLAHRKTNLFCQPIIRELKSGWYDSNLIHITLVGQRVRSKSEVIISDALYREDINYDYEKLLIFEDGTKILPDFTITKADGTVVYWEHLGMLGDYGYRKDWERKQHNYADHGITIANGKLMTSQDELSGAINSQIIAQLITEKLL
ncbi:MAG: ATP-dependent RecD-like DNA helicase [Prevotella sp.]|jgi:ATP-dependent exoDNAse (exonuclease V) alpha subunit|nr:ATP-dependent RecD-like DNA helicase [Prevotella sp.]